MECESRCLQIRPLKTTDPVPAKAAVNQLIELTGEKKHCRAIFGGIIKIHNNHIKNLFCLFKEFPTVANVEFQARIFICSFAPGA